MWAISHNLHLSLPSQLLQSLFLLFPLPLPLHFDLPLPQFCLPSCPHLQGVVDVLGQTCDPPPTVQGWEDNLGCVLWLW